MKMPLIEISENSHPIQLHLSYASADNFTHKPVYTQARCYLIPEALACLERAIALADDLGLIFRIYDAFRPAEAQWILWSHTPDPNFLADPRKGSPHSRGAAIDLAPVCKQTKELLPMGTPFDTFSPLSHHGNRSISAEAQKNRMLLLGIMSAAGWDFYQNEWWHYQLFQARSRYPLLSDKVLPATHRLMS